MNRIEQYKEILIESMGAKPIGEFDDIFELPDGRRTCVRELDYLNVAPNRAAIKSAIYWEQSLCPESPKAQTGGANTSNPIHTKRRGPFPCKGSGRPTKEAPQRTMASEQIVWMKENKPLSFTGDLRLDLPHLPVHLRHL